MYLQKYKKEEVFSYQKLLPAGDIITVVQVYVTQQNFNKPQKPLMHAFTQCMLTFPEQYKNFLPQNSFSFEGAFSGMFIFK